MAKKQQATEPLLQGQPAPDFEFHLHPESTTSPANFRGKKIILYFYPKDDTSGCTAEACDFRDNFARLQTAGVVVLGVSPDSMKSHEKFSEKYALNFPLIADESKEICEKYKVWVEKSMYGRKYMGVERSTFVIDEAGIITHEFRKVSVPGHVEMLLKLVGA